MLRFADVACLVLVLSCWIGLAGCGPGESQRGQAPEDHAADDNENAAGRSHHSDPPIDYGLIDANALADLVREFQSASPGASLCDTSPVRRRIFRRDRSPIGVVFETTLAFALPAAGSRLSGYSVREWHTDGKMVWIRMLWVRAGLHGSGELLHDPETAPAQPLLRATAHACDRLADEPGFAILSAALTLRERYAEFYMSDPDPDADRLALLLADVPCDLTTSSGVARVTNPGRRGTTR